MSENVASRLATLTPAQRALYELALKKKEKAAPPSPALALQKAPQRTIPRASYGDRAPLSIDQERLWFIQQLDLESPVYNVYSATRYKTKLEMPAILSAMNELVRRHEILRTTYPAVDGTPVQQIAPYHSAGVPLIDLTGLPEDRREAEADRASNQVVTPPFYLDRLPIFRVPLVKVHDDDFVMPICIHHIASDRVSYDFINVELLALYQAFRDGLPSPLPEPGIQFADFAIWQRRHFESSAIAEQIDYWKKRLEGAPELLRLPADHPRPPVQTPWGARRHMVISREQSDAFKVLAQREEVTLFIAGLALFKAFLVRLTGEERLIVGTPMDYRQGPEMEGAQGFFLNQLALYTDLTGNPTVHDVVQRVRETAVGAYAHHDLPFAKVVELLRPERDLSRIPFTQVVFLLITPHPTFGNLRSEEIISRPFWVDAHRTQFDMTFAIFWQDTYEVSAIWEHNTDLFDGVSVNRWKEQFRTFWAGFVADRGARLWDLPMLPEAQRRQVLHEWNDRAELTGPAAPAGPPVHERIAAQAARTPEATAVEGAGLRLTYAELERRANGIAQHLRRLGIGPEDLVGVCLERTPDLVASLLGVWKAGAAYLPLDPSHPAERLAAILEDAGIRALVSEERLLARIPGASAPRRVLLDKHGTAIAAAGSEPLAVPAAPESLAYTIYTSGSTGRPKGVQISHGALASFLDAVQGLHRLGPDDAWLAVTTVSFDIAAMELYLPLLSGARVVLADRETTTDGALLGRALAESGATVMQATPSGWRVLLGAGGGGWEGKPDLRMLCGGEALPESLAARLRPLGKELWNQYGPTEATIWSTAGLVEPQTGDLPLDLPLGRPLGRPLANTRLYLLDPHLGPVPQGTPGELWLGGAGLARGYLRRPDLTAERFLPDPYSGEPGARLYRTGDLARHLASGEPAFLGRADHQIKLRGYRIELGEIEAALRGQPAVGEAVVLLSDGVDGGSGDARLIAFLVPRPGAPREIDAAGLRTALQARLPDPMVPAAFVTLDELPQTPAGKVDRRALARRAADASPLRHGRIVAPRNPAEELLAGIWEDLLGAGRTSGPIGVYDDFFALGGHSLLATQLLARVQQAFGVALPVQTVFRAPNIAAQAGMIAAARAAGGAAEEKPIVPLPRPEHGPFRAPLSFAQERMWFLDRLAPGTAVYNMPLALRVTGALDVPALERTFAAVVRRQESLRTSFPDAAGKPVQEIAPADPAAGWPLPVSDLAGLELLEGLAREEALAPFDLVRGPLLRTRLLRLGADDHVLLLTVHHIVSDLWSMGVLVREVADLYPAFASGGEPRLPDQPVQYADFAVWQREHLQGEVLEAQLAFWRGALAGAPAGLELPADRPRPAAQSFRGASAQWTVDPELARSLAALGRRQGATLFMTLAAALSTLLSRLSGQDDLVLGIPIAGRRQAEVEGLLGMFVNSLPLRVNLAAGGSFADLLERVSRAALGAFDHQDVPFEKIVEDLQPRRDMSRHPLFQAVLSVQNVPVGRLELPGLVLEPVPAESTLTKFDLTVSVSETDAGLAGRVEYAADLYDAATVERWLGHFRTLLAGIVTGPGRPPAELPLLTEEERRQILTGWNRTAAEYPQETIHALFAEQAARTPEAVAVTCGEDRLTYRELRGRAGRLARRLRALGVGSGGGETRVGLLAGRSPELIVGLLGILEAGGAYLPLDPAYPPERLQFVLGDAAAEVLVAERRFLEGPLEGTESGRRVVWLGDEASEEGGEEAPAVAAHHPDRLAYVMYTSGSTGEPKGVMVTHRNVVRLVRSAGGGAPHAIFGPDRTFLQFAPVAFDASTLEIWGPLLSGGRLALFPGERASLDELADALASQGVDSLWLTAGLFHSMVDHRLESLRPLVQLLAGGDVVSAPHAQRVLAELPGLALVNGYGPTEGTTFTCCHRMTAEAEVGASVPIGRPIGNARVYVLDREGGPVPVGVAGELYAGGDGLARGYLDRPALTAERFVPDAFGALDGRAGERLYRTGDLVRWRPDGALEFLGRNDGQVKVRGFRVEPGEVESVLARHPEVLHAAVGIAAEAGGGKALVAYVVPRNAEAPDLAADLKGFVRVWVPEPMVPSTWVLLESLPLTPNGKVDRRALAAIGAASGRRLGQRAAYVAPRTPLEERLVEISAQVLGVERVGIYDNFFDLGGHSLLGAQLMAQLRDHDGAEIPLQALFEAANFAELADWITERELEEADDELLQAAMEGLGG